MTMAMEAVLNVDPDQMPGPAPNVSAFANGPDVQHSDFDIPDSQAPAQQPTPSDEAAGRQGRIAAVAQLPSTPGTPADQLFSNYTALTEKYATFFKQANEDNYRNSIAADQQTQQVSALAGVLAHPATTPEIGTGAALALRDNMQIDFAARAKSATEEAAVSNMQNLARIGDTTQAALVESNIANGDAEQVIRDYNTKRLMMQAAIDNARVPEANQGWFRDLLDNTIGGLVPFQQSLMMGGSINVDKQVKNWYDGLFSGQRQEQEDYSLWSTPVSQFGSVLDQVVKNVHERSSFLGYHNQTEQLNALVSLNSAPPAWATNLTDGFDNLALLPIGKAAKVLSLPGMLIRTGGRDAAVALATTAFNGLLTDGEATTLAKTGLTKAEIMDNLLPKTIDPTGAPTTVTISSDANSAIERSRNLIDNLGQFTGTDRYSSTAERQAAMTAWTDNLQSDYGERLKDIAPPTQLAGPTSSITQTQLTIGKVGSGGYASEKTLNKAMASMGIAGHTAVQDESGQWFGKITENMPETGTYTTAIQPKSKNILGRMLLQMRQTSDTLLANQAQMSGNLRANIVQKTFAQYRPALENLPLKSRELVGSILTVGQDKAKFLNDGEFNQVVQRMTGRLPTDAEKAAYQASVDVNDISYGLLNWDRYKYNAIKGYKTVSFDSGMNSVDRINGIIQRDIPDTLADQRVHDLTEGTHYHSGNPVDLAKAKEDGKILVTMQDPQSLTDGVTSRQFLGKPSDFQIEPLRMDQVPYKPGLNRIYTAGQNFLKQAAYGVQADTGTKFLKSPSTFAAGSHAEMNAMRDTYEAARQGVLNGADAAELDENIFQGRAGYPTGQDFIDNIGKTGKMYNIDEPFEAVYDRQMPSAYAPTADFSMMSADSSPEVDWMRTRGALYYSERGDRLMGYEADQAPVLDPFKTIDRALMNAASTSSFSDFKESAVARFAQQFRPFTDATNAMTDYEVLKNASVNPNVAISIKNGIEAQREAIGRILGWKTDFDRQADEYSRQFLNWVEGSNPDSLQHDVGAKLVNWIQTADPAAKLRGAVSDMKLGMFNIARLPIHLNLGIAATMLSPKLGLAGWGLAMPLRAYMANGGEQLLSTLADRGVAKWGGFAGNADMKNFFRWADQNGFLNINASHEMGMDHGVSLASGGVQKAREMGRVFYNTAEYMNRSIASRIAWGEASDKFGAAAFESPEFKTMAAGRAEDYAMGMSKTSAAAWQRGITSVPTQFWAYNARMLEAMGGNTFTPAQRMRLIAGQTLMYGAAGAPILPLVSEMYNKATGQAPALNTLPGVAERGLVDEFIYHMSGADVEVGKREGSGGWLTDTIRDIMGMGQYGEKSTSQLLGGASMGAAWDVASPLSDVIKYAAAESGDSDKPLTKEAIMDVAKNISTVGQGYKAWMIYRYGTLVSNPGNTQASDIPKQDAFYMAVMGAEPDQERELSAGFEYNANYKDQVAQSAKLISMYRSRRFTEPDNAEHLDNAVNTLVRLMPPAVRSAALKRAQSETSPDLYTRIERDVNKDKALIDTQQALTGDQQ